MAAILRTCDSCGHPLTSPTGQDVFFVVRVQVSKAVAWGPGERDRARLTAEAARRNGDLRMAAALEALEPATFPADRVPSLEAHADLRVCAECVQRGPTAVKVDGTASGIDLLSIIRAVELGERRVAPSETT